MSVDCVVTTLSRNIFTVATQNVSYREGVIDFVFSDLEDSIQYIYQITITEGNDVPSTKINFAKTETSMNMLYLCLMRQLIFAAPLLYFSFSCLNSSNCCTNFGREHYCCGGCSISYYGRNAQQKRQRQR